MLNSPLSRASGLGAVLLLVLTGCASPKGKFQCKKDPSYQRKLEKVLVVYSNVDTASTLGRDYSDRFVSRVTELLKQKSVPSESIRMEKEVLDRNAPVKAAAARFRPQQFLSFVITRLNTSMGVHQTAPGDLPQFMSEMSAGFEFNLMDAQSGKNVWRAEADFYTSPPPEALAEQLIEHLVAAKFF